MSARDGFRAISQTFDLAYASPDGQAAFRFPFSSRKSHSSRSGTIRQYRYWMILCSWKVCLKPEDEARTLKCVEAIVISQRWIALITKARGDHNTRNTNLGSSGGTWNPTAGP